MTIDTLGGVWSYGLDLVEGLKAYDINVTLAVLGPRPDPKQRLRVTSLAVPLYETDLPLDWLAQRPDDVNAAGDAIARLADSVDADLVHLNSPALLAARRFPVPTVAVCHSCVKTWWEAVRIGRLPAALAWQAELVARAYCNADALVAPTRAFAEITRKAYGLRHAPLVVHNGRDSKALATSAQADHVFTAGRLWDEGKNIAALDRIAGRIPCPAFAAGSTRSPHGEAIALRHIHALGPLGSDAMASHLAARPIYVSLARYEPFGLAVLEAAQAGCALILADSPGFRELWQGAALLVPPDDEEAATLAIVQFITDRAIRNKFGRLAANRAARYGVAPMASRMSNLYQYLLSRAAAA